MTTLQHALARGLEIVFQLEEGEVLTEPVPSRDRRRAILLFEATEGGAGVLGRLASEPAALAQVARAALELMHYREIDAAVAAGSAEALTTEASGARCVAGCYRCLLSYYNQPDHELIDRKNVDALTMLLRLARSRVAATLAQGEAKTGGDWHAALARWGLPAPDPAPLAVDGTLLPFAWRAHLAAASMSPVEPQARAAAEALGFAIALLPEAPGETPPSELVALLGATG
jgi:hypothetical protein